MKHQPKLIVVSGPDGSGKTTQLIKLAERLERQGQQKVAAVTIWDLLLDPVTKSKLMFRCPREVDGYLRVLESIPRGLFLYHCFYQALELAKRRNPDICLINAYWYKYYATEVAHGGDPKTLLQMAECFPKPDMTFYLRVSPEEAFQRKADLSGYETGFAEPRTQEAFVAFQTKAQSVLEALAQQSQWIELNGKESIDVLTQSILDRIEQEGAVVQTAEFGREV